MSKLHKFANIWKNHYEKQFGECFLEMRENEDEIANQCFIHSEVVKEGNYPRIFYHGLRTKDVVVLTHGLSDSPWYVESIAKRFYKEGANVVMPLLPAHGLKEPEKAMEDAKMDTKWRYEIDVAVEMAKLLGNRVSVGGFSTGGALSLNKILRDPTKIGGGLFLFAGALDIGAGNEFVSKIGLVQKFLKREKIIGYGQDPYKYPTFPKFGAVELAQIIEENDQLISNKKLSQPVFAAHSIHDTTAKLEGILHLLSKHAETGGAYIVSQNVKHAETPLSMNVPLDSSVKIKSEYAPQANPLFEEMMDAVIHFFKNRVVGTHA